MTTPPPPTPQPLCAAFAPLLPLLSARELDAEQETAVRTHIAGCAWCRAKLATFAIVDGALHRHFGDTDETAYRSLSLEDILRVSDVDADESALPTVSPLPPRTGGAQRPHSRLSGLAAIAAVLLVAVLAGTIFSLRTQSVAQTRTPVELHIPLKVPACNRDKTCFAMTPFCPRDAAWSPGDTRVALLGYCATRGATDPHLLIFDTQSGTRLLDIGLLPIVEGLPNLPVPGKSTPNCARGGAPSVAAYSLLWSRDGVQLEIPFLYTFYNDTLGAGDCSGFAGMLLIHPDGGSPRAFFHAYGDGRGSISLPENDICYGVWDLDAGTYISVPLDTSVAGQAFSCLAPALSYAWSANGSLLPKEVLPTASAPSTTTCLAPGNPNGGATVSIWQPGVIERLTPLPPYENTPPLFAWGTPYFVAASPDGRYVAFRLSVSGTITPPGYAVPNPAALGASNFNGYSSLPIMSTALAQRLAALPTGGMVLQAVSPRPDGRVVATGGYAVMASDATNYRYRSSPVILYDCASGHKLATLPPIADSANASPTSQDSGQLLRWSPDGKYLLYADSTYGAGTIWGPAQLPH